MPYLGNELATQFQAFVTQTITGDGSTGYTLDRAVANGKELLVYINNVKQEEGSGKSYTASGTTITFSEAVASGDSCYVVFLGSAVQTVVPPAASIVSSMFANSALTLPNTLDVDAGITVDNITIDGTEIDLSSGNLTFDVAGDIVLDADGGDIIFKDDGTSIGRFISTSSHFVIQSDVQDKDIIFQGDDGGSTIEAARFDMDAGGHLLVGRTSAGDTGDGHSIRRGDSAIFSRDASGETMQVCRNNDNGELIRFKRNGNTIGHIANIGDAPVFRNVNEDGITISTDSGRAILLATNSGGISDDDGQIGSSSNRFNQAFIKNGVTTGSDKNEKQDIESLTSKELKVANKLSALFKTYKWKDSVAEKGDKARTHSGIIAQDIQSAFSAEGLDASDYGMFMSDTWTNEDGKEQTRLGVRYPELFSFIFSSIDARLTALESK